MSAVEVLNRAAAAWADWVWGASIAAGAVLLVVVGLGAMLLRSGADRHDRA